MSSARPRTDTASVLGLVFAFLFFPLGIVFSTIGLRHTREDTSLAGRGFATAGLALSLLATVLVIAVPVLIALTHH